jgi:hypothetical protein
MGAQINEAPGLEDLVDGLQDRLLAKGRVSGHSLYLEGRVPLRELAEQGSHGFRFREIGRLDVVGEDEAEAP